MKKCIIAFRARQPQRPFLNMQHEGAAWMSLHLHAASPVLGICAEVRTKAH